MENLNLQKLRNLINIDLPYNPTKLEQRKGRIERIGQESPCIYLLNLLYKNTVDENVVEALSERLKNNNEIFGAIPDTLDSAWSEALKSNEKLIEFIASKRLKKAEKRKITNWFSIGERGIASGEINHKQCNQVIPDYQIHKLLKDSWEDLER